MRSWCSLRRPAQLAAAVYGLGLCALFGGSALYHRWPGDPSWRPLLRRIDHSTIFVFIAASCTPPALLILDGWVQTVVLAGVWIGALAGVIFSVVWISAPRALVAGTYLGLGWIALIALPQLVERLEPIPLSLIVIGGVLYSIGALVYARQRPDPGRALRISRGLPCLRDRRRSRSLHRDGWLGDPARRGS